MQNDVSATDGQRTGRRSRDRRAGQRPIDFPDRRKGERRSGEDRRARRRVQISED